MNKRRLSLLPVLKTGSILRSRTITSLCILLTFGNNLPAKPPATQPDRTVEGRQKNGTFSRRSTRLLTDLPDFIAQPMPERSPFGGVMRYGRSTATGFFRVERVDGRWWLIDPQGYRMIDVGVCSANIDKLSPIGRQAFDQKFGDLTHWATFTRDLLRDNGFDGAGAWSDDVALLANANPPLSRTPVVSFMGAYASEHGGATKESGHMGYPNKCMFLFDKGFAECCDRVASKLAAAKNDPYVLGYFSDNELPFPLDALDRFLTLPEANAGRQAAETFVAAHTIDRNRLIAEDRQQWIAVMAERYFGTVSAALRKYDPNHLYLGSRFYGTDYRNDALLRAAGKYVDVVSMNLYAVWTPKIDGLQHCAELAGRPLLISEFYAKAEDAGLANTDGAGWIVHTQKDRGNFYQNFALSLIESKAAVGWHWFRFVDNDPLTATDVNPNDSNKGMLDRTFVPYTGFLELVKPLNDNRYGLADYFDGAHQPAAGVVTAPR